MVLNLTESLMLSVALAAAACALFVASGGGLLLGLALYSVVGSVTLAGACSLAALDERVRVARNLRETEKRRAYA